MSTHDIFSTSINYKFRTRWCSIGTLIVFLLKFMAVMIPLIITIQTGGLWIKHRFYVEAPAVRFMNKYLLIVERGPVMVPIVCSTITAYQNNPIIDGCNMVKIQQVDTNKDRQKDILRFEYQFYSDKSIQSFKLLLFFEFKLKDNILSTIESLVLFDSIIPHEIQKVHMIGHLKLYQKKVMKKSNFARNHNETVKLTDYPLINILANSAKKKVSAEITNIHVTWQTGFVNDEPVTISGEIFYSEQLIYYQPYMWEELKWAWIQYSSLLIISIYITRELLSFLFSKNYLKSFIIIPWKNK